MTSTVLEIYNAALSACRARGRLNSISQASKEREECDIWYDIVLSTVQEAAFWPACRNTARLALASTRDQGVAWMNGDPEANFKYSYELPPDYLRAWFMPEYQSFTLSYSNGVRVLNTNAPNAALVYARKEPNPALWSPGQRLATIYGLASMICGSLVGQNELAQLLARDADVYLAEAQANSINSMNFQVEVIPPQLVARGYEQTNLPDFFYPFGRSFSQAIVNV